MEIQSKPVIYVSVGSGAVTVDGQEASLPPRERDLLVALAALGRPASATMLAEMLYTDLPYERGVNALRVCIHRVRTRFGRSCIGMLNSGYRLDTAVIVDVREGRALLGEPLDSVHRARALEVARWLRAGVAGSLAYEEWYAPFGRDAQRLGSEIALQVARTALGDGRYVDANAIARQLTYAEPTNEDAWQLVVASQLLLGRRMEAIESFRALQEHLHEELGVPPSDAIRELIAVTLSESKALRRFEMSR